MFLFNLTSGPIFGEYYNTSQINAIDFNEPRNILASGSLDKKIKIWDIEKQKCLYAIELDEPILGLSFSPNGNYLVANCLKSSSAKVFETKTFSEICCYFLHNLDKAYMSIHIGDIPLEVNNRIESIIFDDNNKTIFTAGADGSIHKWK